MQPFELALLGAVQQGVALLTQLLRQGRQGSGQGLGLAAPGQQPLAQLRRQLGLQISQQLWSLTGNQQPHRLASGQRLQPAQIGGLQRWVHRMKQQIAAGEGGRPAPIGAVGGERMAPVQGDRQGRAHPLHQRALQGTLQRTQAHQPQVEGLAMLAAAQLLERVAPQLLGRLEGFGGGRGGG